MRPWLVAVLGLGIALTLFGHLSRVDYLWPAQTIAAAENPCGDGPVRVVGFTEPSLVFASGDWAIDDGPGTLTGPCASIWIEGRAEEAAQQTLNDAGWVLAPSGGAITAMDLGKGREITLTPYVARREATE